jgi:hypothetical protein
VVSSSSLSVPPPALESIDLLELIEGSRWKELRRAIEVLALPSSDHDLVVQTLSSTNARGETPAHTLAWKAPTELVLQALNVRGVSSCLTMCDRDLNTPLHLACANVTNRSEFAVIRNMANLAPQALALQNEHGDTRKYTNAVTIVVGCHCQRSSANEFYDYISRSVTFARFKPGVHSFKRLSRGSRSSGVIVAPVQSPIEPPRHGRAGES